MKLYTYQIAQGRRIAKERPEIYLLDTTVKSGEPLLAPTWDMVLSHKKGLLSNDGYTELFMDRMEYHYHHDPDYFDGLMQIPSLALGCYCSAIAFCHRHLLVRFLNEIATFEYRGEL